MNGKLIVNSEKYKLRKFGGITLISLVITIVVLIILASVAIYLSLGDNGIFVRSKEAKDATNKQEATEIINLKITTAQMNKYAEKQEMPTLQELADILCDDNEIQYVTLESKVANIEKITVGDNTSIYTKLSKYPYEFEINGQLQLASINGVKLVSNNNISNDYSLEETKTNETWMGKPIYRKTIFINALPNNTTKSYSHNIENVDIIWVNVGKTFYFSGNIGNGRGTAPLPMIHYTSATGQVTISVNGNVISMQSASNRSEYKAYVTVEYTKK